MTAPWRACNATLTLDGSAVGRVTRLSYDEQTNETTWFQFGNCNEQSQNGGLSGSGQLDVILDEIDDAGQNVGYTKLKDGTTSALVLRPNGAGSGEPELTGTVTFPGRQIEGDASEVWRGVIRFKGVLTDANQA